MWKPLPLAYLILELPLRRCPTRTWTPEVSSIYRTSTNILIPNSLPRTNSLQRSTLTTIHLFPISDTIDQHKSSQHCRIQRPTVKGNVGATINGNEASFRRWLYPGSVWDQPVSDAPQSVDLLPISRIASLRSVLTT